MAGKKTVVKAPKKKDKENMKAQEQRDKIPSIYARIDRLVDYEGSKVKAFASVNIDNSFAVHGLRVMDSDKGLFVSMPTHSYQKEGKVEYREVFHPITKNVRYELEKYVLEAYEQKLQEEQNEIETQSVMDDEVPNFSHSM